MHPNSLIIYFLYPLYVLFISVILDTPYTYVWHLGFIIFFVQYSWSTKWCLVYNDMQYKILCLVSMMRNICDWYPRCEIFVTGIHGHNIYFVYIWCTIGGTSRVTFELTAGWLNADNVSYSVTKMVLRNVTVQMIFRIVSAGTFQKPYAV